MAMKVGGKPGGVVRVKQRTASGKTKIVRKFPVNTKGRARNALARINQAKPPLTASQKAGVMRAARTKLGHSTPSMKK